MDSLLRNRVLHSLTVVVSVIDYANHCGRRLLNESRAIVVSGRFFRALGMPRKNAPRIGGFETRFTQPPRSRRGRDRRHFVAHVDGRARTMITPSGSATFRSLGTQRLAPPNGRGSTLGTFGHSVYPLAVPQSRSHWLDHDMKSKDGATIWLPRSRFLAPATPTPLRLPSGGAIHFPGRFTAIALLR